MTRRSRLVRGQALLELAVFGMVALAALSFLIRVGMKMNFDQEIRMAAFRRALAAAAADNGTDRDAMGTVFHQVADRQMPDATDGFMGRSRVRTEASAFVEWGDRLSFAHEIDGDRDTYANNALGTATQTLIVVRNNNNEDVFRSDDFPADDDFATGVLLGRRGVVLRGQTTNQTSGTITQTRTSSSLLGASVRTGSSTTVNTRTGGQTVGGGVGAATTNVNW